MLMEAYYASETMAVEKEMQKRKERCLKRWKKLIIGLRLRSRLQGEYKAGKGEGAAGAAKASSSKQTEGVSQFQALPDDKQVEDTAPAANTQPSLQQRASDERSLEPSTTPASRIWSSENHSMQLHGLA